MSDQPIPNPSEALWHITGCVPVREVPSEDRHSYEHCFVVVFQRGFEQNWVAVYFDHGCNAGDCEEAAFDYLIAHQPQALTDAERESQCADGVIRVR